MTTDEIIAILAENRQLRIELDTIRADLAARQSMTSTTTSSASAAIRVEPYSTKEFAALIGRNSEYVSDRCRLRIIRSLPGKPYLIPVSELERWMTGDGRARTQTTRLRSENSAA